MDMNAPPPLTPDTEKTVWKGAVQRWVTCIRARAAAGDDTCKYIEATLCISLYNAMHPSFQHIAMPVLDTAKDEEEGVQAILALLATETPLERCQRMLRMTDKLLQCSRGSRNYATYAAEFYGLASKYLRELDTQHNIDHSELFALMMLRHAGLSKEREKAALAQLSARAQQQSKTAPETASFLLRKISAISAEVQCALDSLGEQQVTAVRERLESALHTSQISADEDAAAMGAQGESHPILLQHVYELLRSYDSWDFADNKSKGARRLSVTSSQPRQIRKARQRS